MKNWLLTWNADRWAWDDDLGGYKELIADIEQVGRAYSKWTCGVNKSIEKGDRIFMIKLGSAPKGIIASGYAATSVFEGTHWDEDRKRAGKKARRIFVEFDKIKDYDVDKIISFDELLNISDTFHWSTQSSGITIPEEISQKIEEIWAGI
ncbi:MAG: hypothetical protein PHS94_09625 [Erysipelotrichaceae bacterium]|nr:hypothetical protein [Erysipelotrichaceae bacterium]